MKNPFKKAYLPFLDSLFEGHGEPDDYWKFVRMMQDENGMTHHPEREMFALQKGAYLGSTYAMCELARYLYAKNDQSLPQALAWWHRAAKQKDAGALYDLAHNDILKRIKKYHISGSTEYADIEMKCAMLTEWILTDLGRVNWENLKPGEKIERCSRLIKEASELLFIRKPEFVAEDRLCTADIESADGLAYYDEWMIKVRTAVLNDYERLIQVLFHEMGHLVTFSMWLIDDPACKRQRERYGVTEQRVYSWYRNDQGLEVPVSEEDPDTLSYGVWLTWALYFK